MGSYTGTWIHDVGAGWLMTTLSQKPLLVSLVQAAGTLPILALALPAGALADVVDRRKLLIAAMASMLILAASLALLTSAGMVTPGVLLLITLGLGVGSAISNPAWQVTMTGLVPREQLPQASALNSVSMNLSRAIGPAIGGIIVSAISPAAAFALNAFSFVGVIIVLLRFRPAPTTVAVSGERFVGAVKAGVRYVRFSAPMHAVLVRTASFVLCATSLWALMPLISRDQLNAGARGFGIMYGCLGAGAVITTLVLPRFRARASSNTLLLVASVAYAATLVAFAFTSIPLVGYALMLIAGASWVTSVVCLNVAAQSGAPLWVRARALACYLAVFYGCMALGSPVWGLLAGALGLPTTMLIAAGGLLLGLLAAIRFRIRDIPGEELDRSTHWEEPAVSHDVDPNDGPVVVTIEYRIPVASAEQFTLAMAPVAGTRYRDGAISWFLSRDTEDPERWLEIFIVESWAEHLRQHDRVTVGDRRVQEHAKSFHAGVAAPAVSHLIAAPVTPTASAGDPTLEARKGCA
jgi:MFS family permease/quinol monooxygenase YgiN